MEWSSDPNFILHIVQGYLSLNTVILIEWRIFWSTKVVDFVSFSLKSSMWHLWLATLISRSWLMHFFKGFCGPSCMIQWLHLSIYALLVHKQKMVMQSLLTNCSSFQSQNLAYPHGALTLPLIYQFLIVVIQFSLV